jgi:adenosylcobinamide-phosphate synthase
MISLIIAVLLDLYFGEPKKWHPLVAFGKFSTWVEKKYLMESSPSHLQRIIGVMILIIILFLFLFPLYFLQKIALFNWLISPIILYFCIAANSLKQHNLDVFKALEHQDLKLARKKVAKIVSRDCQKMDEIAVRKASIESVLENGADAIFAPIFWFLVAGPAGVVLYRISNTLDAMWGYKTPRYLYFGWAAARLDDILNFIPARLTALSYILLGNKRLGWHCWRTQARLLNSPNAGVVMTAGAGSLNVQLGGTAMYHGFLNKKPIFGGNSLPENDDLIRANQLIDRTLILWLSVLMCNTLLY